MNTSRKACCIVRVGKSIVLSGFVMASSSTFKPPMTHFSVKYKSKDIVLWLVVIALMIKVVIHLTDK